MPSSTENHSTMAKTSHPYPRRGRTPRQQSPSQPESLAKKLVIYKHDKRRRIGLLCESYEATVDLCRTIFPALLHSTDIAILTKDLDICEGELAEICAESWNHVADDVRTIEVVDQSPEAEIQDSPGGSMQPARIFLEDSNGKIMAVKVDLTSTAGHLMEKLRLQQVAGIPHYLVFEGMRLANNRSLSDQNVCDGDTISLLKVQLGGKPVIYLLAPQSLEASVELSLVPQWSLSAIYPVMSIKSGGAGMGESVSWRVRVHPEGHLTELSTGLDIAYLYWEAVTNPRPLSPPLSPHLGPAVLELGDKVEAFDPANASLNDENSVLISVSDITPYLDAALKALGLHIEARTSFITYWLPSMLKHEYIAFRFLPQASYEQAAPLCLSPTPDVVTRVFMVFEGIEESGLKAWPAAQKRVKEDVSSWVDIVGVDVGRTMDKGLFRVIEWGGMEVFRSKISL